MTSPQQDDELDEIMGGIAHRCICKYKIENDGHAVVIGVCVCKIEKRKEEAKKAVHRYAQKMVVKELKAIAQNTNITNRAGYIADRIAAIEKEGKS